MIVRDLPRCGDLVTDTTAPGNTRCCLKVAGWRIALAHGDVYHVCVDCLARRLSILADAVDTAAVSFLVAKK